MSEESKLVIEPAKTQGKFSREKFQAINTETFRGLQDLWKQEEISKTHETQVFSDFIRPKPSHLIPSTVDKPNLQVYRSSLKCTEASGAQEIPRHTEAIKIQETSERIDSLKLRELPSQIGITVPKSRD